MSLGSLAAQSFVHKVNPYPLETLTEISQLDSVNILAVMVEFQEDRDNATFGNGKFGSIYTGDNAVSKEILDPLPHDKDYFEDHLQCCDSHPDRSDDRIDHAPEVHHCSL